MIASHQALNHRFAVDGNESGISLLRQIFKCFESVDGGQADTLYRLEVDGATGVSSIASAPPFTGLAGDVASRIVTAVNRDAMLSVSDVDVVHAAVVALDEATIVFPAHSGSGKSTMSAALVAAGFSYLSDELAPIRGDLTVESFPKPIVVGPNSMPVLDQLVHADLGSGCLGRWFLDPELLEGGCEPSRSRRSVTHVALPVFRPGAAAAITEVSPGTAASALFVNSFNLSMRQRSGLERLAGLALSATALRIEHGDAHEVAELLKQWVAK